jgi:hypothetical protein
MKGKRHKPPWWRRGRGGEQREPRPRESLTEMVDGAGSPRLLTSETFERGLPALRGVATPGMSAELGERIGRWITVRMWER